MSNNHGFRIIFEYRAQDSGLQQSPPTTPTEELLYLSFYDSYHHIQFAGRYRNPLTFQNVFKTQVFNRIRQRPQRKNSFTSLSTTPIIIYGFLDDNGSRINFRNHVQDPGLQFQIRQRLQQMNSFTSLSPILIIMFDLLHPGFRIHSKNRAQNINFPFYIHGLSATTKPSTRGRKSRPAHRNTAEVEEVQGGSNP